MAEENVIRTYSRAYQLALENAQQYLEDAKFLQGKKSFGHSMSLAVLGMEELSKAFLYHLVAQRIIESTDFLIQGQMHSLRGIYDHAYKLHFQAVLLIADFLGDSSLPLVKEMKELLKNWAQLGNENREEMTGELVQQFLSKSEVLYKDLVRSTKAGYGPVVKYGLYYLNLHERKMRGLYVDVKDDQVISPRIISKEESDAAIDKLKKGIKTIKESCRPCNSIVRLLLKQTLQNWRLRLSQIRTEAHQKEESG